MNSLADEVGSGLAVLEPPAEVAGVEAQVGRQRIGGSGPCGLHAGQLVCNENAVLQCNTFCNYLSKDVETGRKISPNVRKRVKKRQLKIEAI